MKKMLKSFLVYQFFVFLCLGQWFSQMGCALMADSLTIAFQM